MITEEKLKERVLAMADDFRKSVDEKLERALRSGALDLEGAEDNYLLPKIVLAAILKDGVWQYAPLGGDQREKRRFDKEVNNLSAMI